MRRRSGALGLAAALLTLSLLLVVVFCWCGSKTRAPATPRCLADMRRALRAAPRVRPAGTTVDVPVLYINLARSRARRERMETHLELVGAANSRRVEGVDGAELANSPEMLRGEDWAARLPTDFASLARILGCREDMVGEVGCTLSHLKALSQANDSGQDTVLILEDDADLGAETVWPLSLSEVAKSAPEGWGAVSLCDHTGPLARSHEGSFYDLSPTTCESTAAYLVSSRGLRAAARALRDPEKAVAVLESCAADRLIYALLAPCYGYSYPMISTSNDHSDDFGSLIHPDHTDNHVVRAEQVAGVQLGLPVG